VNASSVMWRSGEIMQTEMFSFESGRKQFGEEIWVQCPGFPRYLVSSLGRFKQAESGRLMKGIKDVNGYPVAQLTIDGKQKAVLAHRLVCVAFHGPQPAGRAMVNHIDGQKHNNAAANLEWVSGSGNARHSWSLFRERGQSELVDRYITCHNSV